MASGWENQAKIVDKREHNFLIGRNCVGLGEERVGIILEGVFILDLKPYGIVDSHDELNNYLEVLQLPFSDTLHIHLKPKKLVSCGQPPSIHYQSHNLFSPY